MRYSRSFSARLTSAILFNTSILFLAAITVVSFFSHRLIGEEAQNSAANALRSTKLDIEQTLREVEVAAGELQWVILEHRDDTAMMYHITRELLESRLNIVGSAIAFRSEYHAGKHFFSPYSYRKSQSDEILSKQLGTPQYDYFQMEWYTAPMESGKPHWSEPYFDDGGGEQLMTTYSIPLKDEKGETFAILTADINLEWLSEKILATKPYANSYTILIGKSGHYISHQDPKKILNDNLFSEAKRSDNKNLAELAHKMVAQETGVEKFRLNGDIVFAVYGPVGDAWSAAIISPYKDVFAPMMRMNLIIILVAAFGLFFLFAACVRTIRKLTQPITEFSVVALNMAKGNFKARLPEVKTQDEIRKLHDSFEYMQKSITSYITELKSTTIQNERFESELNIARKIQMGMVPQEFPERPDCHLSALLRPAREVGGDLYDFVFHGDSLYFAVGDVSGKGVPAALFMAMTRSAFRFLAARNTPTDDLTILINQAISDGNENNMFVTLFIGKINLKTRHFEYCNAGHNPIIIISPDGTSEFLHAKSNIAAGIISEFKYQTEEMDLAPHSRLLIYTDGVTEAEDSSKAQFGDERLLDFTRAITPEENPQEIVNQLYTKIKEFTGDAVQNDDITIFAIELDS